MKAVAVSVILAFAVSVAAIPYEGAGATTDVVFTTEEQSWLDSNSVISVGYSNWPPYEYVDVNGNLAGVTGEIAGLFSDATGSNFVKSMTIDPNDSWTGTLKGLGDGSVDVAFMIADTGSDDPQRKYIAYTDPWYFVPTNLIVKDDNRNTITMENFATKKIVTVNGYAVNTWLDNRGIAYTTVGSTADALRGVAGGTYDVHIESWEVAYRISVENGIEGLANAGSSGYEYALSIGYNENNRVLGAILQKVLDATDDQRPAIIDAAVLSNNAALIKESFTPAEQTWLDSNSVISVGYSNWPPHEYVGSDGQLAGVTGDIAMRFSEITGSNFVKSMTIDPNDSWAGTLEGLGDGSVGVAFMIADTGSSDSEREGIAYTDSWYSVPTNLIVKSDDRNTITMDNFATKKIVTVDGYAINTWLYDRGITYMTEPNTADALRGVADGTYDVHIENWEVAYRISVENGIEGLANAGPSGYDYDLSIGYNENNRVLGGILKKILDGIEGERQDLIANAISRTNTELIKESFTPAEQTWLDSNSVISVGYSNWPPHEYVGSDGQLAGVTGDIAMRFSEITGSNFVKSMTIDPNDSWAGTLEGLGDGSVGVAFMIADTGSSDSEREGIAYTDSWYSVPTNLIVKDADRNTITMDNFATKKIVTVDGYAINTWLYDRGITYMTEPNTADALRGVADGTYDVHIENWEVAYRISVENGIEGLANAGPSGYDYDLSIGYNENNRVLGGILKKILDGIGGEQQTLIDNAISRSNTEFSSIEYGSATPSSTARICR